MNFNKLRLVQGASRFLYTSGDAKPDPKSTEKIRLNKTHVKQINKFLESNPDILPYRQFIPEKYLNAKSLKNSGSFYLISPKVAESVAQHIAKFLRAQDDQVVCETNPGLGLISAQLLQKGIMNLRLYEGCCEFQSSIKTLHVGLLDQIDLHTKNFFNFGYYAAMDQLDRGDRVESLLQNVPKKSWSAGPALTVIGTMQNLSFLKFLVKCLVMQTHLTLYGRVQVFALMNPKEYNKLSSDKLLSYWSILFHVLFDVELLDTYDDRYFLPWESERSKRIHYRSSRDFEPVRHLVRICMKKDIPLKEKEGLQFYYFVRRLLKSRHMRIIPLVENLIPGCGLNLIVPKLKHDDYFEDLGIFTKFSELRPNQILALFKEIVASPNYEKSSFVRLIEQQLMQRETIETALNDHLERNIATEIENKSN